jgi:hypothetical protein
MRNGNDRLRALNVPRRVQVALNKDGLPIGLQDTAGNSRAIEDLGEIWRIDDEWWRVPTHRRYVEAIIEGGKRVVLYEDLITREWWMQKP